MLVLVNDFVVKYNKPLSWLIATPYFEVVNASNTGIITNNAIKKSVMVVLYVMVSSVYYKSIDHVNVVSTCQINWKYSGLNSPHCSALSPISEPLPSSWSNTATQS